jgi:cytochrome c biogenesis protein CcmG, thiol:disulfide interchange protein DsbE
MRRFLFLVPVLLILIFSLWIGGVLASRQRLPDLPSTLLGKPLPKFALSGLPGWRQGIASTDFGKQPMLLNVFASWCLPCVSEHPVITKLGAEDGIPILAINYKDKAADALAWLERYGNPYEGIGVDPEGRAAIDLGVYGVPETFVIDRDGRVRYRHAGPLTPELVAEEIRPLLTELSK